MNTNDIETCDNDFIYSSSTMGNPSSFNSLSPLHKPKSLSIPISLLGKRSHSSTLGGSTKPLDDSHNHDSKEDSSNRNQSINDNHIDSLATSKQGKENTTDENHPVTLEHKELQNESKQILEDDIHSNEREGMSAVEMKNKIDRILGDLYSIQIKNAILMDSLVLMGSDL